ncbi:hypothetical protein NP493_4554g00000 [Ridgeia piscesae]|uniref:Reverse transcriptase n=1 Tax=Ridgeia piscesae TaxID=27915 RepID=A0AAD9J0G8_RIDPI|nr:hypothetical protein NP493_4554g00000 [Ridgeia piscesae]
MADIRQPDELVLLTGNIAENWRKFRQEFELYMIASGHDGKPEKQKVALLLHVARKQAIDVFNTFALTEEQKADYDVVVQRFETYCSPKTNETYERYMFNSRKQFQGEAVEQFVTELKIRAQSCNFGDLRDSMIRDRLVLGITSQRVRERLLREEDLTLGKAVQICQAAEISERQIQTIAATVDGDASLANNGHKEGKRKWTQKLQVENCWVSFKLDTGSDVSIISEQQYLKLKPTPQLEKSPAVMTSYSGERIQSLGVCRVSVRYKKRKIATFMEVVQDECRPALLGGNDCEMLGLLKRVHLIEAGRKPQNEPMKEEIKKKHSQLFRGNGALPGVHTIVLKDGAKGVIHAPRRVAVAKRPQLKKELDRQVKLGFLAKVDEPTEWVNSLVIVEKANGQMRLCIDPKDLNKEIKREHFQIPTKEEILGKLENAKYFSKMDATAGFHQIQLDKKSSMLTTFNTPFGRYRYLRLPMGICSAPEVFHKTMHQFLEDFEGVSVYMDDIIVWGSTEAEHDERLEKTLERLTQVGLVLNVDKCYFRQAELPYLGEVVTQDGVKPDPEKVQAVTDMPTPTNATELQRVLGMVTYLGRYIPNLSARTAPLRSLLGKDIEWQWNAEQEAAWIGIKEALTKHPVLQYYDESKAIKVSSDASKDGIGAVLLQETKGEWMAVAYASRSMTTAEKNYAQIEKEQLSVVFACERFHSYIYGRRVLVETDHKPLISISKKQLGDAPPRLQRLLLRIQKYDLVLEYTPGKYLVIADTLSRSYPSKRTESTTESEVHIHVCAMKSGLPVSERKWEQIAEATANDEELQRVVCCMSDGTVVCPKPYLTFIDELSIVDGVIVKGQRVVVPRSMRTQMLQLVHEGHMGIEKCKRRAREILYWPNMNQDIYETVSRCDVCQVHRYAQPKEPLRMHERPNRPWAKVGCDLFYLKQKPYLLTIDYYSHYPETALLASETSGQVIIHLKALFSRYGIPSTVMSDGGPQFASAEFQRFSEEWGFDHKMSSPYYPQSNGLAENGVKVVKRLLTKAAEKGEDPYLAMLAYRDAPLNNGKTPAELLLGRN